MCRFQNLRPRRTEAPSFWSRIIRENLFRIRLTFEVFLEGNKSVNLKLVLVLKFCIIISLFLVTFSAVDLFALTVNEMAKANPIGSLQL